MEIVKAQQHKAIEESDEAKQLMAIGESDEAQQLKAIEESDEAKQLMAKKESDEAQQLKAMEKSDEAKQHDLQLRHLDKAPLAAAPLDASQDNSALWNLRANTAQK